MKSEAMVNDSGFREDAHAKSVVAVPDDLWRWAGIWWRRILRVRLRQPRRLRLCESLPLGERRFVAVVEFERSRFLVGGTSASMVLLAKLDQAEEEMPSLASGPAEMSLGAQR